MVDIAPTTESGGGVATAALDAVPPIPLHSGTELLAACKNSNPDEAMRLLGIEGVDVNAKTAYGMTPLHYACKAGLTEVALALVEKEGVDMNAQNKYGQKTPLHFACENGLTEVALALVSNAVDVNAKNKNGTTPLHYACDLGHLAVAQLLLAEGAHVDKVDNVAAQFI